MSTAVPLPGPVPPAGAEFPSSQKCHSGYGGERWRVMGMLLVFLLLNLVTGSRSPSVWMDEVMYADPAINWLRGDGFTSTAWSVQHGTEFWASNVPLHAVLLRGWLALTGVSALAVRSLNYLLFAAACYLLWDVTRRHALIVTRSLRLAFLATLLLGFGVSASYRSGRYDGVGILLSAGIAAIALRSLSLGAAALLFVSAALLPWAGVQLLPYWFALGLIAWLVSGRAAGRRLLVIAAGIMCGAAALVLFYQSRGVLGAFVNSVFLHAAGPRHPASWNGIADPRQIDRSAAVLLVLLLAGCFLRRDVKLTCAGRGALLAAVLVPGVMLLAGKYPDYYTWMAFLPLCTGVFIQWDAWQRAAPWPRGAAFLAGGLLLASSAAGKWIAPLLLWKTCDPAPVETLVQSVVRADDEVYCDFGAYYAVKTRARRVFLPTYLGQLREDERGAVSVLVVHPSALAALRETFPGNWISRGRIETRFSPWEHRLLRATGSESGYWLEVLTKANRS